VAIIMKTTMESVFFLRVFYYYKREDGSGGCSAVARVVVVALRAGTQSLRRRVGFYAPKGADDDEPRAAYCDAALERREQR
jgi:hypothetical protein